VSTASRRPAAIVTGATGGIGEAIASRLASEGWDLMLAGRSAARLAAVAERVSTPPGSVYVVGADLASPEGGDHVVREYASHFQVLDCLVLCAGVGWVGALEGYPCARAALQFDLNVLSPLKLIQSCLPMLRAAAAERPERGTRIIALASLAGRYATAQTAAYGASKAALTSLCASVSAAESEAGVCATAISPGFVDTEMTTWVRDQVAPGAMIRADDIAELVVALTRMSRFAVVPEIVITRPGQNLYRA
jgi:3-oxoacyl-[acyl-carrier protein] reductase